MVEFWQQVKDVWQGTLWDISFDQLMISLAILVGFVLLRRVFSAVVINRIRALTKRTETSVDDHILEAIQAPLKFIFVVVGYYIATKLLTFPDAVTAVNNNIIVSLITFVLSFFNIQSRLP